MPVPQTAKLTTNLPRGTVAGGRQGRIPCAPVLPARSAFAQLVSSAAPLLSGNSPGR